MSLFLGTTRIFLDNLGLVGLAYWIKDNRAEMDGEAKAALVTGAIGLTFGEYKSYCNYIR